jgi:hypothetical protein
MIVFKDADNDEVSYQENVKKMLQIYENSSAPYSNSVDALLKVTFT